MDQSRCEWGRHDRHKQGMHETTKLLEADARGNIDTPESERRPKYWYWKMLAMGLALIIGIPVAVRVSDQRYRTIRHRSASGSDVSFDLDGGKVVAGLSGALPTSVNREKKTSTIRRAQPHIVLFTIDDMGWNDVGFHSTDLPNATEYMNELVQKSILLSQYYTQPSCTPSRATLMTGKWAHRNGFQNYELQVHDSVGLPLSNKLMPQYLADLGYKTHMVGKWNIGHCSSRYLPHERGFETILAYMSPGHGYRDFISGYNAYARDLIEGRAYIDPTTNEMTYKFSPGSAYLGTYDTLLYRDRAALRIREHAQHFLSSSSPGKSSPFFLWAAQHGMHGEGDSDPEPPEEMLTESNKLYLKELENGATAELGEHVIAGDVTETTTTREFFNMRRVTASVIMSVDNSLKHLVETLQDVGMLSDTVLVVNSDNGGDTIYTHGHPGNNYPLRSAKFGYFEGGIRVPAFIYAPWVGDHFEKTYGGTTFKGLMHHVDLLPTFVGLARNGLVAKDSAQSTDKTSDLAFGTLDGLDMWSSIMEQSNVSPRSELVLNLPRNANWTVGGRLTNEGVALRMGRYKLLLNHFTDSWFSPDVFTEDWHDSNEMMVGTCGYDWYSLKRSSAECEFRDFLFDVIDDPNEHHNLIHLEKHKNIVANMITRASEILRSDKERYGKIIAEYYRGGTHVGRKFGVANSAWKLNDEFVTPWDCVAIE